MAYHHFGTVPVPTDQVKGLIKSAVSVNFERTVIKYLTTSTYHLTVMPLATTLQLFSTILHALFCTSARSHVYSSCYIQFPAFLQTFLYIRAKSRARHRVLGAMGKSAQLVACMLTDLVQQPGMAVRYGTVRKYGTVRSIFRQKVRYASTVRNYC